jgi:phage baseplate assembly protein W
MVKGLGILLPIELGPTGYFNQGFDALEQVKTNFINLIKTRLGERLHQPEFGCGIHDVLFEPLTDENIEFARESVIIAVQKFMPFLELTQITLDASPETIDQNTLRLYVRYVFRNNPNVGDVVILNF